MLDGIVGVYWSIGGYHEDILDGIETMRQRTIREGQEPSPLKRSARLGEDVKESEKE